ncbi:hypothetical protein AW736_23700 [Termitidicoccus mucosus]|uniref:Uncharacterized protein n=1 Tax=Termitidicoccus mucosus TaxID=1184151 RepID=A0A178IB73_9BACT|nr:hypothetical protein AW736_23700 [Opitutaceae bacterium TSB47]
MKLYFIACLFFATAAIMRQSAAGRACLILHPARFGPAPLCPRNPPLCSCSTVLMPGAWLQRC